MEINDLTQKYLHEAKIMQLATVSGDQPWICSVHFVADDKKNLYWLSFPTRRHSEEIAVHDKVAITIAVKLDRPVIAIQAEGSAELVTDHEVIAEAMQLYVERYNAGKEFYNNVVAGKNEHSMYKFTPKHMYLFDEVNFPGGKRQEVELHS